MIDKVIDTLFLIVGEERWEKYIITPMHKWGHYNQVRWEKYVDGTIIPRIDNVVRKWNEVVIPFADRVEQEHITPFLDILLPKLNAFIEPPIVRLVAKLDNMIHMKNRAKETYRRIEYDIDNATLLNNSAKLLVICAVIEMQDRIRTKYLNMVDIALTNSWEEFNAASEKFYASRESMFLDLGDAAIPQISLDSWYSDLTLVKRSGGKIEYISLNDLIGD